MAKITDPSFLEEVLNAIRERGWFHARDVFDQAELEVINDFFDRNHSQFELSTYLQEGQETKNSTVRGDKILKVDLASPPKELLEIVNFMKQYGEGLKKLGFRIEDSHLNATYYPVLERFRKHFDGAGYEMAFIFYVNKEWDPRFGGNLHIFDKDDKLMVDVLPEPGSFISFLSQEFLHEIRVCKRERRSVAGWFHDKPKTKSRF